MGTIEDRFEKDALWAKLKSLRKDLAEVEVEGGVAHDALDHAIATTDRCLARRKGTPAGTVTPAMLTKAAQAADQVSARVQPWLSDQATDEQLIESTDALVQAFAAWPAMRPGQVDQAARQTTETLRGRASKMVQDLESERDNLASSLESLATRVGEQDQKIDGHQQQLADALNTFASDSDDAKADAINAWESAQASQKESGEAALDNLRGLEQEARELVHAGTGAVVATDYGEYATSKARAAWICDLAAAVIGAVGVAAIIFHLYDADTAADGDVGLSLTRLAASLGTLGIAALVAHRGSEHHRESRAAKRTDLALRRVMPFTANLASDIRERIVVDTTDRIFVRGELDGREDRDEDSSLWDRIQQARQERDTGDAG